MDGAGPGADPAGGAVDRWVDRSAADAALSAPTQARLHALLLASERAWRADELADALGLHHTGVRQHLAVLVAAGLATQEPQEPDGRGRPGFAYRALPLPTTPYERLAFELSDAMRSRRSARAQGRHLGERIAADPATDPLHVILRETTAWGFAPELDDDAEAPSIVLRACPFAELAAVDSTTVCQLHLGMAEGLAATTGRITVDGLEIEDPRAGGCRIRLTRTHD